MSYILEALSKEQKKKPSKPNNKLEQNLAQQAVLVSSSQNRSALLWGILLTVAIFLALSAGFWMGTKQTKNGQTPSLPVVEQHTATEIMTDRPLPQPEVVSKTNSVEPVLVPKHKPLVAEQYFEQPPNTKVATISQTKTSAATNSVAPEQPIILGDPRPYQQAQAAKQAQPEFSVQATNGVSDELLTLFQSAIDETDSTTGKASNERAASTPENLNVPVLADMPTWIQNAVPQLSFDMHIYSTKGDSWVKVNGQELAVGQWLNDDIQLVEIAPQAVVMAYQGKQFSMPALSSWK